MKQKKIKKTQIYSTVLKAIQILNYVIYSENSDGVTGAKVASSLGFDRASTHRLLNTLTSEGLIYKTADLHYVIGPTLLCYGLTILKQTNWTRIIKPILENLVSQTDETATFSLLLQNNTRVYADQIVSSKIIRMSIDIGDPTPLYVGASGKAILAALPKEKSEQYLNTIHYKAFTDNTIIDRERLLVELEKIREMGYSYSIGEHSLDAWGVATAIKTDANNVVGAMSICGPVSRLNQSLFPHFGALLKEAAKDASELIFSK